MGGRKTHERAASRGHLTESGRKAVAQLAARLMAEGQPDYLAAKQKAARQLGWDTRLGLPDNAEIDAALREHLALFAAETQPQALAALRDVARTAMSRLAQFSPWLVGPVLTGTANEFSDIEIEIVGVESKHFEMFLLGMGATFETRETRSHRGRAHAEKDAHKTLRYHLDFNGIPVKIFLYGSHPERLAASPRCRARHERASLAEVEKLCAETPMS